MSLRETAGEDRFSILCQLADLQTNVSDAYRDYITSDGEIKGMRLSLVEAYRMIDVLLDTIDQEDEGE